MDAIDRVTTPRLGVRRLQPEDAAAFVELLGRNEAHLRRAVTLPATLPTAEEVAARIETLEGELVYGIVRDGGLIGCVNLEARGDDVWALSFFIDESQLGQGYATEAAAAAGLAAFAMGAIRVEMRCDGDDAAAARVAERLGFRVAGAEGMARRWICEEGAALAAAWPDVVVGSAWNRIAAALRRAHRVVRDEDARLVVRERYLVAGDARAQSVSVARAEVGGRDWLVLTATVAAEHAIGPREALAHNAGLAAGALGLVDDWYVLRDAVPLDALEPDAALALVALVGHEAARLRAAVQRVPVDPAFFEAYAA